MNKLQLVCEGIDNLEGKNRHYEKMKIDFFRARMQQSMQNTLNNSDMSRMQSKSPTNFENEMMMINKIHNTSVFMTQNDSLDSLGPMDDEDEEEDQQQLQEDFEDEFLQFESPNQNVKLPEKSEDSLRDNLFNLNNIILKENVIYYKILSLYSNSSEKGKTEKEHYTSILKFFAINQLKKNK